MTADLSTATALGVIFVASLVRSTFGFGEALIAMPLLSMLFSLHVVSPLIALISVTIAAGILLRDWRDVRIGNVWRLVLASFAGVPVGLYASTTVPESYVKAALAVVIILFSSYSLLRPQVFRLASDRSSVAFGFLAGVLGGAYNTQGPPIVMYGTLRGWTASQFRATLQGFFFPVSLLIVAGHGWHERLTPEVFWLYSSALPVMLVAFVAGKRLHQRLREEVFVRSIHALLILIGVSLLVSCAR